MKSEREKEERESKRGKGLLEGERVEKLVRGGRASGSGMNSVSGEKSRLREGGGKAERAAVTLRWVNGRVSRRVTERGGEERRRATLSNRLYLSKGM